MPAQRAIGVTGTDEDRVFAGYFSAFLPGELHTTTQQRLFVRNKYIGPKWLGGAIADEASMLTLNADFPLVGCFPGDECKRADTNSIWRCISNRGELLTDWIEFVVGEDGDIDGGNFTEEIEASQLDVDGGTFI